MNPVLFTQTHTDPPCAHAVRACTVSISPSLYNYVCMHTCMYAWACSTYAFVYVQVFVLVHVYVFLL